MTGAAEADYLAGITQSTRALPFPDGQVRLITLEDRYWTVYDRLQTERGWAPTDISSMALEGLSVPAADPIFEQELRWAFQFLLRLNMPYVMEGVQHRAVNDDDF